jgi:tetratricopeptide (TPR) repeat protein
MRRLLLLGALLAGTSPFAQAAELEIKLNPSLAGARAEAWRVYAEARRSAIAARPATAHNQSLDDFAIELAARRALAGRWLALRGEESARDPYLETLVAVEQAGHLEEYVLAVFGKPGWTIPGDALAALDYPAFHAYAVEHLRQHGAEIHVRVHADGVADHPERPGRKLPEFEFTTPDALCAQRARAQQALERWYAEAAALDGVPLAAENARELAASAVLVRSTPRVRERGITWVSPRAANTSFIVGFCEVDRKRYAESIGPLETAVALSPRYPSWRLELAKSLTMVKRFDEADQMIESVIASSATDSCRLGVAWRSRGYLLFDRGELRESYEAYRKSLEYDPGSSIARSELELLRQELARMPEGEEALPDYEPPALGNQVVKQCP